LISFDFAGLFGLFNIITCTLKAGLPVFGIAGGMYTDTLTVTGDNGLSLTANLSFTVKPLVDAETPVIVTQPYDAVVAQGGSVTLSVFAGVHDGGTLTYQWFGGGTPIDGATDADYTPPTSALGTVFYHVEVINTNPHVNGEQTAVLDSDVAIVTVHTFTAAADPSGHTYPAAAHGYGTQLSRQFVISNIGTGMLSNVTAGPPSVSGPRLGCRPEPTTTR
jgi:hypothetical protein